ncbi:hypothetical protein Tco_1277740 [Tanacetum coccineum]
MRGVNGLVSSHTHGWDKLSSSMLDLCFFDRDFQCPLALPLLSDSASVLCDCCGSLFLGDLDQSRLGAGLPNVLRIRLDPSLFLRSLLLLGVPDSKCCETSSKAALEAGMPKSCEICSFSSIIRAVDVGWLREFAR